MRDGLLTIGSRVIGALLCVGIIVVHVEDQGGLTAFADPDWIGWSYRLVELSAALVALALLSGWRPRWVWGAGLFVAAGPFLAYLLTRTVGLPQDSGDVGNWADPVGTASLVIEGLLVVLAASKTRHVLRRPHPARSAPASRDAGSAVA